MNAFFLKHCELSIERMRYKPKSSNIIVIETVVKRSEIGKKCQYAAHPAAYVFYYFFGNVCVY